MVGYCSGSQLVTPTNLTCKSNPFAEASDSVVQSCSPPEEAWSANDAAGTSTADSGLAASLHFSKEGRSYLVKTLATQRCCSPTATEKAA